MHAPAPGLHAHASDIAGTLQPHGCGHRRCRLISGPSAMLQPTRGVARRVRCSGLARSSEIGATHGSDAEPHLRSDRPLDSSEAWRSL
jgi:hypothetical protein